MDPLAALARASPYGALGALPATLPGLSMLNTTPGLPLGWEMTTDPNTGKPYYFNRATGQSSWTPPGAVAPATLPAAAASPAAALPAGWEAAADPATGKTYYFNRAT